MVRERRYNVDSSVTSCLKVFAALLHEQSYPRVGFSPILFPRMGGPHHRRPLLSRAFLATRKVLLFVIGRVRFLVKPRSFFANHLLVGLEGPPARLTSWD